MVLGWTRSYLGLVFVRFLKKYWHWAEIRWWYSVGLGLIAIKKQIAFSAVGLFLGVIIGCCKWFSPYFKAFSFGSGFFLVWRSGRITKWSVRFFFILRCCCLFNFFFFLYCCIKLPWVLLIWNEVRRNSRRFLRFFLLSFFLAVDLPSFPFLLRFFSVSLWFSSPLGGTVLFCCWKTNEGWRESGGDYGGHRRPFCFLASASFVAAPFNESFFLLGFPLFFVCVSYTVASWWTAGSTPLCRVLFLGCLSFLLFLFFFL